MAGEYVRRPGTTGRQIVVIKQDGVAAAAELMGTHSGFRVAQVVEASPSQTFAVYDEAAVVMPNLGLAVVQGAPDRLASLQTLGVRAASSPVAVIEDERIVRAIGLETASSRIQSNSGCPDYIAGFKDGVESLAAALLNGQTSGSGDFAERLRSRSRQSSAEKAGHTWALLALNVAKSKWKGKGIKLAILDTGIDDSHPDLKVSHAEVIVASTDIKDHVGHGTHCAGIACGPREADTQPGYGVAPEAELHVFKVLDDSGTGVDGDILAGIEKALERECQVISLSLGSPPAQGDRGARYERAGQSALRRNALVIAAAGNDSSRPWSIQPVSCPANAKTIMAVGAVRPDLKVAEFSNGAIDDNLDLVAPGVDILSSWPGPQKYHVLNGTSMATPFVSGVAALILEATPNSGGEDLWQQLLQSCKILEGSASDYGSGLVQAH